LSFFNLTQYDKVIGLDNDVFLRQNIAQWFDYPAPAATQARGTIEWNSGAMVIEPNEEIYNTLLKYIPKFEIANKMKELMASILVTATKVFSRHSF
jgi:alpha-N-acetylglucosamine transferase